MIAHVQTGCLNGLDAKPVTVEVDIASGLPNLIIVGLPDAAVNESRERIRAAIKNSGFEFPMKKVLMNLAPADMRKEGTGFDLPLALGVLLANDTLSPPELLPHTCFVGEVSLEGSLRGISGVLSIALMAREQGFKSLVVPQENVAEASLVEGIDVFGLNHLQELPVFLLHPHSFLKPFDSQSILKTLATQQRRPNDVNAVDFKDIKGQATAKRALEIAAAGGHNVLMVGPPGSGKSMLAKALTGILPPLSFEEMLSTSRIYSVAGILPPEGLMATRPFRAPHHTASMAGLTGGGSRPRPGELSLAHEGVLFLDEFVEFPRNVLEVLRQPLEEGHITVSRVQQTMTFPAQFMLVAALNPCPCGYKGDTRKRCTCTDSHIARYIGKLSGPLIDRIDIQLEVPRLANTELLAQGGQAEPSATIAARVAQARDRQRQRFSEPGLSCNRHMMPAHIKRHCHLTPDCQDLMHQAVERMSLSARAFDRILRLSRTIADLDAADTIAAHHLAEALQYRALDRLTPQTSSYA